MSGKATFAKARPAIVVIDDVEFTSDTPQSEWHTITINAAAQRLVDECK